LRKEILESNHRYTCNVIFKQPSVEESIPVENLSASELMNELDVVRDAARRRLSTYDHQRHRDLVHAFEAKLRRKEMKSASAS